MMSRIPSPSTSASASDLPKPGGVDELSAPALASAIQSAALSAIVLWDEKLGEPSHTKTAPSPPELVGPALGALTTTSSMPSPFTSPTATAAPSVPLGTIESSGSAAKNQ